MPTGVLHIADPADYAESRPDTPTQEAWELLASIAPFPVAPQRGAPVTDWLRVTQAVRCGARVSLEAERPGWKVSLRFHDVPPFDGAYHISVPLQHLNEHGTVSAVECIEGNRLVDHRHSMLNQFDSRYLVTTTAQVRGGTQRIWRIGISDVTVVAEADVPSDDNTNA